MFSRDRNSNESMQENRSSKRNGDRVVMVTGFVLATAAALFPWYVFFNQDSFGGNPMNWGDTRNLSGMTGGEVFSVSPLAIPDEKGSSSSGQPFDPITTATVPDETPQDGSLSLPTPESTQSPASAKPGYKLLHVANGRALIEDSRGVYLVQVGSALPDNSKLATMEQRDGKWVIITSNGEVVSQ